MKEATVNQDSTLWLDRASAGLRRVVMPLSRSINYVGMAMLVLMMLLTFVDVIGRYVFNRPITGSIELVEFMMVVLVAFVVAYGGLHGSLITVDVVTERLRKRARAVFNTLNSLVNLCVFLLITWQSAIYAITLQEAHRVTATFAIPIYPFVYLIALGSAILCLVFIYNLLTQMAVVVRGARWQLWSVLFLVVIIVAFLFSAPAWITALRGMVSPITAGIIGTIIMVLVLFIEMPIGISMVMVGFVGMAYIIGLNPAMSTLSPFVYATAAQYTMSIVPLFVLMGTLCFHSGISRELFDFAYKWFGRLPGGLAIATIGASAIFSAVSGSSVAGVVTLGTVALPEMRRYKYDDALSTGSIAAGGCLNILIPPSMILVIYGILTETSIGKLLLAGFIPGIMQAAMYMIVIFIMCKRNPLMGPRGEPTSWGQRFGSFKNTWAVAVLFILVMGGMYVGAFTPTEAAGIGACGSFIISLARKHFSWSNFHDSLLDAAKTTAMVFVILIGANIVGSFLTVARLPAALSELINTLQVDRYVIITGITIIYLLLGMVMSSMAMIVLTVPIFLPVVVMLGFDPIWFGILVTIAVEMAQITPPVGINVFVMHGVAPDVPMYTIFKGIIPFLVCQLLTVVLITAFPQIALFLPSMMK